jgi:SAM-dependent methyltransferase
MAGDLRRKAILDIACSFGWFEDYAVGKGCLRIVGIEIDPALADYSTRAVPEAQILVRDAARDLSDLGNFDVVSAFDFIEHLPRGGEVEFLRQAAGLVTSSGRVLISVPHRSVVSNALDPAFYFGHRHYSLPAMEGLLEAAGLAVRRTAFAGGLWEQLSLVWLYIFKWVFRSDMPFAEFLEGKRRAEYERWSACPGPHAFSTMFIEAGPAGEQLTGD